MSRHQDRVLNEAQTRHAGGAPAVLDCALGLGLLRETMVEALRQEHVKAMYLVDGRQVYLCSCHYSPRGEIALLT